MSEYRVHYYEPGLGWCLYINPYPGGTVYRSEEEGRAAAEECQRKLCLEVEIMECGAAGIRKIDLGEGEGG